MKLICTNELIIKKSKFIGYFYNVNSVADVKMILESLKKEHKKARHLPYAYKIENLTKKSDDKEPSNTAGSPILNIIIQNNLENSLIVVVRYFGGIKLGIGGLIRAYSNTAKQLLK